MSGHSKWSTIKRQKGVTDARRGQLFTKLGREIAVAIRHGGSDPEANFKLRLAVQRAREHNMPLGTIDRAIKRAAGKDSNESTLAEVVYEGYGPGGAALLLHAVTDNRNRTVAEVRSTFTRNGGSMAEAGSVAWNFQSKGVITVAASGDSAEEVALSAIDAGAEDVNIEDSTLEVYTAPEKLETVRKSLEEQQIPVQSAELSMVPKNTVRLDDKVGMQTLRLLDRLEELDDVQRVYSNADFPPEVLEAYGKEG
ncbi:MAG: YebC/PmpR family DNA-binding transcriptional regulator [Dehalococcoidia bacterium]